MSYGTITFARQHRELPIFLNELQRRAAVQCAKLISFQWRGCDGRYWVGTGRKTLPELGWEGGARRRTGVVVHGRCGERVGAGTRRQVAVHSIPASEIWVFRCLPQFCNSASKLAPWSAWAYSSALHLRKRANRLGTRYFDVASQVFPQIPTNATGVCAGLAVRLDTGGGAQGRAGLGRCTELSGCGGIQRYRPSRSVTVTLAHWQPRP